MIVGRIIQGHSKKIILPYVKKTKSFFERARGLLGYTVLGEGEGLLIVPCSSVHTFFMKMPIDVVFLNRDNIIVKMKRNLKPQRFVMSRKASSVLEIKAGQTDRSGLKTGDHLVWEKTE